MCDWPNNDRLTIFDSAYETTNFYYHYYMCCFCSHYYGQLNREHTVDDVRSLFRSMQAHTKYGYKECLLTCQFS